jgi:Chromo (CHRromatin Organisation MOdifier) domain
VLGITQNLSTAFHPQTDGLSEQKNQWIEQYLRLICANQDDWARWLPIATAVHNNVRNSTTGFAPSTLLIGWEPPLFPDQIATTSNQKTKDYMAKFQKNRLMAILALNKTTSTHIPMSNRYNLGQRVWLEGKNLPMTHGTAKLLPKRYGPFTIIKLVSPVASQLELPISWNIHPVFHNSLLTPYVETNAHGPNFMRPPPDLINGEAEYEVEAIRSHRYFGKNKRLQYLLKWKGYPEADNTWESEGQLNAPDLLKQYNRRHNIGDKRAMTRVAITYSSPTSLSWISIPTPISCSALIQTSPSSITECCPPTCPMNLPPQLRLSCPVSPSHSIPSSMPPMSPNSHPTMSLYHLRPRSTSLPLSLTLTRQSAQLRMASFPLSTVAKLPTHSRPKNATRRTTSSKNALKATRRRSTTTSSSQDALTAMSRTTAASQPSSPLEKGSSSPPSSSNFGMMDEFYVYPARSTMKNRT